VARTEGIGERQRAHRSMASGHSGARKLTGGGTTERGELGSGLTGARAAARWPGDGGKRRWRSVLGARWGGSCGLGSEQRRAGVSVVMAGVAPNPVIVAGEGHAGARKGEMADGTGLNAIEGRAA
jgi:hypothetical protein